MNLNLQNEKFFSTEANSDYGDEKLNSVSCGTGSSRTAANLKWRKTGLRSKADHLGLTIRFKSEDN